MNITTSTLIIGVLFYIWCICLLVKCLILDRHLRLQYSDVFFYKNTKFYRFTIYLCITISIIFLISITLYLLMDEQKYNNFNSALLNIIVAISTSFFVSFVFYMSSTVRDRREQDLSALRSLRGITHCYMKIEYIRKKYINSKYTFKCRVNSDDNSDSDFLKLSNECYYLDCKYNVNHYCIVIADISAAISAIDISLNQFSDLAASSKPELLLLFGRCKNDLYQLNFALTNYGFLYFNNKFEVFKVHNYLMMQNNTLDMPYFRDGEEVKKHYITILNGT